MQNNITSKLSQYLRYFIYCVIAFFIVFLLFLILDKIVMPLYVRHGVEIVMPDVFGKEHYEAKDQLSKLGFKVEEKAWKNDPYLQYGKVLSQIPASGTIVKKGRTVYLTISLGEESTKVPGLINLSSRDAENKLLKNNLKLGKPIGYEYSREYPEDMVIDQSYEEGMEIPKGTVVYITVSRGQEPQNVTVPYIIQKLFENAVDMLEKNGLCVGRVEFLPDEDKEYLPNTVLRQMPQAGMEAAPGDSVHLWVTRSDSTYYFQKQILFHVNR